MTRAAFLLSRCKNRNEVKRIVNLLPYGIDKCQWLQNSLGITGNYSLNSLITRCIVNNRRV